MTSKARTVPSSDADTKALPLCVKQTPVTPAKCSDNVWMQNPLCVRHSFTFKAHHTVHIWSFLRYEYIVQYLAVIASCYEQHAIGRVRRAAHSVVVALLVEEDLLALPLPNDQLPQLRAPHCDVTTNVVESDRVDAVLICNTVLTTFIYRNK